MPFVDNLEKRLIQEITDAPVNKEMGFDATKLDKPESEFKRESEALKDFVEPETSKSPELGPKAKLDKEAYAYIVKSISEVGRLGASAGKLASLLANKRLPFSDPGLAEKFRKIQKYLASRIVELEQITDKWAYELDSAAAASLEGAGIKQEATPAPLKLSSVASEDVAIISNNVIKDDVNVIDAEVLTPTVEERWYNNPELEVHSGDKDLYDALNVLEMELLPEETDVPMVCNHCGKEFNKHGLTITNCPVCGTRGLRKKDDVSVAAGKSTMTCKHCGNGFTPGSAVVADTCPKCGVRGLR